MTRTQTIIFRVVLFIALGAITFLATTRQDYSLAREISDKANHILAFYVLTFLVDFSFPERELGLPKILLVFMYGLLIEIIQGFLPDRTPSLLDLFADAAGIAMYKLSLPLMKQLPFLNLRWRV